MSEVFSDFQFVSHNIPILHIDIPAGYPGDGILESEYFANYTISHPENKWVGAITLGFREWFGHGDDKAISYNIVITGVFAAPGEDTEESKSEFIRFLTTSGPVTLIPIARSSLTITANLMGYPNTCVIPNINVFKMDWNKEPETAS